MLNGHVWFDKRKNDFQRQKCKTYQQRQEPYLLSEMNLRRLRGKIIEWNYFLSNPGKIRKNRLQLNVQLWQLRFESE